MVAKISVGNSLYGAISYNETKVEIGEGKVLWSNNMIENEEGELDMHSVMKSFEEHLLHNNRTKKPILHISLNPHPGDKLTDEQFIELAKDYMEFMGYGSQPYLIYKHEDIERHHLHIVTTNVDVKGNKIKDSNNYHLNKKVCRELEQKYNLQDATKAKEQRKAFTFSKIDTNKGNVKIQIGNVITPLSASYKFQSFGEYRTLLEMYSICVEESKGVRNGRTYEGLIYYATNDKGEKISNPFQSSLFGKTVGYKSINSKCGKHKQTIKDRQLNKQTATRVNDATIGINDKQKFIDALKADNIDVVFRENDAGRIYGVTFIDHNNHCVFNGSRLGKEFSANAINERFEAPKNEESQTQEQQHYQSDDNSFSMGGVFDLAADGGDDPEEDMFRKRMQKKKRKGRKI